MAMAALYLPAFSVSRLNRAAERCTSITIRRHTEKRLSSTPLQTTTTWACTRESILLPVRKEKLDDLFTHGRVK